MTDKEPASLDEHYPARRLLSLISDKWTPVVLYCLAGKVGRFNEMQRRIPDISRKMLAQVLRALERQGLVERTVHSDAPPKTEYRLTADGKKLHEPVAALCLWAQSNAAFVDQIIARKHAECGDS